eukprot:351509-Chlamydomonas_euryale.AAC.6
MFGKAFGYAGGRIAAGPVGVGSTWARDRSHTTTIGIGHNAAGIQTRIKIFGTMHAPRYTTHMVKQWLT